MRQDKVGYSNDLSLAELAIEETIRIHTAAILNGLVLLQTFLQL